MSQNPPSDVSEAKRQQVVKDYGNLPLSFEANQGQTDDRVKFLARGNGYTLFLTSTEAVLSLRKPDSSEGRDAGIVSAHQDLQSTIRNRQSAVLCMKLIGANPAPRVLGLEELPGKDNYFIGSDPKKWHTNVSSYGKVRYQDVYPGVDLVYYGNQRQLEHDFVVAAGADPKTIELQVQGARALRIDDQGELVLETRGEEVRLLKPHIYQEVKGARQEIAGGYVLRGKRRVGFEVAAYDGTKPLIIDPVLSYSTYLGGSDQDLASAIAVDSAGNAYVTGLTLSTNFPTTPGAFQTAFRDCCFDAFVTKIDTTKSGAASLIYSTYLGGNGSDPAHGIAVDSAGNAYITGGTSSTNFPTTPGAFQTTSLGSDAFVTKLSADGSTLLYSTYLGGSGGDEGSGIAVDSAGNAYVTGDTSSTNFPTTSSGFQTALGGGGLDAFMTKIDTTKSGAASLTYSTYLGGIGSDQGFGIAVDSAGNAYVTGVTSSTNFPTTPGAFQTTLNGGTNSCAVSICHDAFVTKIDTTKSGAASLIYSTYLGGNGLDQGFGIAVDSAGNAYVAGMTDSTNFPTTPGAFQNVLSEFQDVFVTKLNVTGSALVYSTYLGGNVGGNGRIAVDSAGNAYVTGDTASTNFPTTPGAFQSVLSGVEDAFLTKLNVTGSALVYSTYLGGSGADVGIGIAVDSAGNAYVVGSTSSTNFPTTSSAFQTAFAGVDDVFISKFAFASAVTLSATSLSFGSQNDGSTSAALTVTLTNTGDAQLTITGVAIGGANSGDFAQTNTCGSSVAAGANCTISVTFKPTAPGTRNGTLTITDNAAGSPQTVTLSGTGVSAPGVTLSASSFTFASQAAGTTSTAQTVRLTNSGDAPLNVTSINITGANPGDFLFAAGTNCPTSGGSLAVATSCTISIAFKPAAVGTRNATLTIANNAASSPDTVTLTGTGIAPVVTLSSTSLTFSGQLLGTTSTAQTVTLTNSGPGTLTVNGIVIGGANSADFAKGADTCGASVNAGASCTIPVSFAPTLTGNRSAAVTINDNDAGSPHTVNLTGTGTDFSLGPGSGGPTTATVTAGQTATYSLQVVPLGFNGAVTLTCSGAPAGATCSLSPTSVTLSGSTASPFSVAVATTARSVATPRTEPERIRPVGGLRIELPVLLALALLAILARLAADRRLKATFALPTATVLLGLLLIGCSGGSSGTSTPKGTAPGTSTLTVTGTSGTVNRNITLTLTVN